jgi:hypothetical protein
LRVEVPCVNALPDGVSCTAVDPIASTWQVTGASGTARSLTLRIRGVDELKNYVGGTTWGSCNVGGSASSGPQNIYALEVSDPPQRIFLNAGINSTSFAVAVDFTMAVSAKAGAFLTLSESSVDGAILKNDDSTGAPIVVPGVPPAPAPFAGQFLQVDVIALQ